MSGPRMSMSQMNGSNNRRPQNLNRMSSAPSTINPAEIKPNSCSQHDDLIKFIHDSWSKVENDRGSGCSVIYYQEQPDNQHLKDFQPFDLEGYWGRRLVQNVQQTPHS